ncbi:unnamed protein product [Gordionus sp. m RMFG-2023]|uniref:coronin-1C-like n=1 Tax=Gordionus sp. m RMFG-2023 TaxID=3053472 RepID=UPI0030E4A294
MSGVRVVRQSKFRHVYGQAAKRENCYEGIRITKSSNDSNFVAINPKFMAVITEAAGGGAFLVLPLEKFGKIEKDYPLVLGHKGPVLDLAWCNFNDNIIASCSEDTTIKIWQIPPRGLGRLPLEDPVVDLTAHDKRVTQVAWHPSANNVLLSVGGDLKILIWNVGMGEVLFELSNHPDLIYYASFNYDGSRIVTVSKDKKIRTMDSRTGKIFKEGKCHEGAKPQRAIYLKDGAIFTTGFSKMSERQYALRTEEEIDNPIILEELDSSNGVLFPFYDPDTNLMYLSAKGDASIRYYEITDEYPYIHYINVNTSTESIRGLGFMPKRGVNVTTNEIDRFFKITTNGFCQVTHFVVPRKSENFQDDLYPDTASDVPALSAEEWAAGKNHDPILMSMKDIAASSEKQQEFKATKKANVLNKMPLKAGPGSPVSQTDSAELKSLMKDFKDIQDNFKNFKPEDLLKEIYFLKETMKSCEKRLTNLENKCK